MRWLTMGWVLEQDGVRLSTPQIIIMERVGAGEGGDSGVNGPLDLRYRVIGSSDMALWARGGARIPTTLRGDSSAIEGKDSPFAP